MQLSWKNVEDEMPALAGNDTVSHKLVFKDFNNQSHIGWYSSEKEAWISEDDRSYALCAVVAWSELPDWYFGQPQKDEPKSLRGTTDMEDALKDAKITINRSNGTTEVWQRNTWTEYTYLDHCFIIIQDTRWVGIYNMNDVDSIIIR